MNNDVRKVFGKSLIFRYIGESRREEFLRVSDLLGFEEGDKIIQEGEISDHVFLVVNGEVSVNVTEKDGKGVYISTIGEGEIFGEAGIFLRTARTANVVSLGKSRILRISREDLLKFIKKDPTTGMKILMIVIYGLLRKLRESNQELAYERLEDSGQDEIDALVESLMKD